MDLRPKRISTLSPAELRLELRRTRLVVAGLAGCVVSYAGFLSFLLVTEDLGSRLYAHLVALLALMICGLPAVRQANTLRAELDRRPSEELPPAGEDRPL